MNNWTELLPETGVDGNDQVVMFHFKPIIRFSPELMAELNEKCIKRGEIFECVLQSIRIVNGTAMPVFEVSSPPDL